MNRYIAVKYLFNIYTYENSTLPEELLWTAFCHPLMKMELQEDMVIHDDNSKPFLDYYRGPQRIKIKRWLGLFWAIRKKESKCLINRLSIFYLLQWNQWLFSYHEN